MTQTAVPVNRSTGQVVRTILPDRVNTRNGPASATHWRAPVARRCMGVSGSLPPSVRSVPHRAGTQKLPGICLLKPFWLDGAAPESNRPSVGLPRRTGFEDRSTDLQPGPVGSFERSSFPLATARSEWFGPKFGQSFLASRYPRRAAPAPERSRPEWFFFSGWEAHGVRLGVRPAPLLDRVR
jgi:hypothetical protein